MSWLRRDWNERAAGPLRRLNSLNSTKQWRGSEPFSFSNSNKNHFYLSSWKKEWASEPQAAARRANQQIKFISLILFLMAARCLLLHGLPFSFISFQQINQSNKLFCLNWMIVDEMKRAARLRQFHLSFLLLWWRKKRNGMALLVCRPAGWNFIQSIHCVHCFHSILYFYNRPLTAKLLHQTFFFSSAVFLFLLFHPINHKCEWMIEWEEKIS